jgi:hypothetical protein
VFTDETVPPFSGELLADIVVTVETVYTDDTVAVSEDTKLGDEIVLYDLIPEEVVTSDISGDAVDIKVNEDTELGVRVTAGDSVDDALSEIDLKPVAVTERAALDVPEGALDEEITDEPVASDSAVVVLELEAQDETVVEPVLLRDFKALIDMTGLSDDSTDTDEDDVVLRVAIEEREKNGDEVEDKEATNEMLA